MFSWFLTRGTRGAFEVQRRLPLEGVFQVLESCLLLVDGAATQSLERRQFLQLLLVDPVSFLTDRGAGIVWKRT